MRKYWRGYCTVQGCPKELHTKTLCFKHYEEKLKAEREESDD